MLLLARKPTCCAIIWGHANSAGRTKEPPHPPTPSKKKKNIWRQKRFFLWRLPRELFVFLPRNSGAFFGKLEWNSSNGFFLLLFCLLLRSVKRRSKRGLFIILYTSFSSLSKSLLLSFFSFHCLLISLYTFSRPTGYYLSFSCLCFSFCFSLPVI